MSPVEFINEPVLVEARSLPDGSWRPLAFQWQGRHHQITELGRQWQEDVDGIVWRCFMIRTGDGSAFELCLDTAAGRWLLGRAWPAQQVV
ncbi:MAG TPA: hypothetical protein VGA61_04985 [Anaerolineae bacterium]